MKRLHTTVALACALVVLFAPQAQAQDDGTVTDPNTGLTWMRCMMGQTWANGTCTHTASSYTFAQAAALIGTVSFAGQSDWRLPNIRELNTIVDFAKTPPIDGNVFPSPSAAAVWSSSPYAYDASDVWVIHFGDGSAYNSRFGNENAGVRLVRGGQVLGLLNPARPNDDYQTHGDGTVTHRPTGLMWQQCREGQRWSGSACLGSTSVLTWSTAMALTSNFAGKTDWRIPSIQELRSLIDYTKPSSNSGTAALNASIFLNDPGAAVFSPAVNVWSSTPLFGDYGPRYIWFVGLGTGYSTFASRIPHFDLMINSFGVRWVRGGGEPATPLPPTDINCLFNWAESRVPHLFAPAHTPTQTTGAISYRAYANNVFLWVDGSNHAVWVYYGGSNIPINVGHLADFLPTTRATACQ